MGEHRQHHLVRLLVLELARSLEKGRHQLERALDRQLDLELRAAEDALGRVETVRTLHLVEHRRLEIARAAGSEQLGRDAKDLRHRPVRLLASASLGIGKLDQARLQEHPDMKVEVTRIDAEPLRELAVGELPVPLLAEHLQHAHPHRVAERLQLFWLVEYQRVLQNQARPSVCPWEGSTYSAGPVKREAWLQRRAARPRPWPLRTARRESPARFEARAG